MIRFLSIFGFDPTKHQIKTEMLAGLTTFLTMSYILAVNPLILSAAGMDRGALFSATIIAAVIATLTMAFYAKMPFALAPGMGLNAYFAYTLVVAMGYSWEQALAIVFVEGILFIILTIFKIRDAIIDIIPTEMRHSITVGIGLFIAYLGLKNGGIIIDDATTLTNIGSWTAVSLIAFGGILLGALLMIKHIRGALFYTILIMTLIGIPLGVTQIPEDFSLISAPASIAPIAFHLDFTPFLEFDVNYIIVAITLLFMDLFDTIGTLVGTAVGANMVDENGKMPDMNKALMADAIGTTAGALCGTSTVTTFLESTTGIMEGGRTGLTSFTVALLFFVALFFSPIFLVIPSAATTCALFIVGLMMMRSIRNIDFSDIKTSIPCFVTILIMPLSGSISEGIVLGMLTFIIVNICTGKAKELSPVLYVLGAFFLLKYITPLL